jgi:predicted Zn-dependent protease
VNRSETLKELLTHNPRDAFARYGLAMEYASSGQIESALQEFSTLLELNPDYTAAYFMSAQTLARAGRVDEARARLRAGVACAERLRDEHARSEMQAMLDELGN